MSAGSRFAAFGAGVLLTITGFVGYNMVNTTAASSVSCKQSYPNIPGKVLLENDKVIVQRFTFPPDQVVGGARPPAEPGLHPLEGRPLDVALWRPNQFRPLAGRFRRLDQRCQPQRRA